MDLLKLMPHLGAVPSDPLWPLLAIGGTRCQACGCARVLAFEGRGSESQFANEI